MALRAELDELWGSDSDDGGGDRDAAPSAHKGDDDDVWGSDGSDDGAAAARGRAAATIAQRDEQSMRAKHYKEGYKDSVAHAREAALQHGFGDGFAAGFRHGTRQGRFLGVCSTSLDFAGAGGAGAQVGGGLAGLVSEAKALTEDHGMGEEAMAARLLELAQRAPTLVQQPFFAALVQGE